MDNLYPQGQYRPRGSMLSNNKGFIRLYREADAGAGAGGTGGAGAGTGTADAGTGDQGAAGTGGTGTGGTGTQGTGSTDAAGKTGWKTSLTADLKGAPFLMKFEDTPEGLVKAIEAHGNLEKLLGNEKVPIPKGPEDSEGWARYRSAMKVPEKPDGYQLTDAKLPEAIKDMMMDKGKFASVMHAQNATPSQAKAMWEMYQQENISAYNKHLDGLQKTLETTINVLKQEWGGAYDANVQLGESVISQFGGDDETKDYLTATLLKNPQGIKFLQKLGTQFAENKIGDFNLKRFAVSPEEAQQELDQLMDINGPYFNEGKKFSVKEQDAAVKKADDLRAVIHKAKQRQAV